VALDRVLGGVNTAVLIASSFTMALGVRCAQLGQTRGLLVCLLLTLLGGAGFMGIKTIEYKTKWEHHLFPGKMNVFNPRYGGEAQVPETLHHSDTDTHETAMPTTHPAIAPTTQQIALYSDPLAGTPDEPKIKPPFINPIGLGRARPPAPIHDIPLRSELTKLDQERIGTFFSIYFCMTGLHGLHVLIGMGLITWVAIRARKGIFGPAYFTTVDMVGLYWHLVDLIWIFLFPLLYLIH
jgi:cytochrome c oxidase subunit 3